MIFPRLTSDFGTCWSEFERHFHLCRRFHNRPMFHRWKRLVQRQKHQTHLADLKDAWRLLIRQPRLLSHTLVVVSWWQSLPGVPKLEIALRNHSHQLVSFACSVAWGNGGMMVVGSSRVGVGTAVRLDYIII